MKYSVGIAILASSNGEPFLNRVARQADSLGPDQERRYTQLTDMMEHYNADFDERKYWTYGKFKNKIMLKFFILINFYKGPTKRKFQFVNK